ncbi:hypothetical protein BST81_03650 [Leptolyngbya sp. 'hensonii']|uniref:M23 family metallopeptidase n=1 Tax=Leptolyngbya sp. 'hensonii' TaxID=1922337 RepID=UPI00094F950F|nr:M23 family metallopeptidase [Leptolyngbya sp. 'hensonii']OLP19647.1 hypothetical protein BST81_03650 [Leptolyngbya sp. 'hensonii']
MRRRLWLLGTGLLSSLILGVTAPWVKARESVLPDQDVLQITLQTNWQGSSFPVENFQSYTSLFGYRRSIERSMPEFHAGLDMAAPAGSYVRSWMAGRVISVSDASACGTSVRIESGNWIHIYCHLQGRVEISPQGRYVLDREGGLQIWEGQPVKAGTRIGRVGMTGRTTGPHLHWGLQYNRQWANPALVLQSMYDQQQVSYQPASRPSY